LIDKSGHCLDRLFQVIATVPFIPGHEAMGTVVAAGPLATIPVF
jgi:D-arabinose 1-dehydrogenase-like Zn-dependent alcohol dehydrogenase